MSGNLERILEFIAPVLFFGGLGAAAGLWIQTVVRKRRLRKLGFRTEDLKSKEAFFTKWGEIAVAQMAEKISFDEVAAHSWSKPLEYAESRAAFEALGFQRSGTFAASPKKWVLEFWINNEPGLFATIVDSPACEIYSEVIVKYNDGSTIGFENTNDCGRRHLEKHNWIHCGPIRPSGLVERALQDRQANHVGQMQLPECLSVYEQAVNETLAWRRSVGLSAEEMKHSYERRMNRRRSAGK